MNSLNQTNLGYSKVSRTVLRDGVPYIKTRRLPSGKWRYYRKYKMVGAVTYKFCTDCNRYRRLSFFHKKSGKNNLTRAQCVGCTRDETRYNYVLRTR